MKVSFLIENVTKHLSLLNKATPLHTQVPVLSNILLVADKEGLRIKATNLIIGVEIKIPAKIEKEGETTVPGKEFLEAINSLPKDKAVLELKEEKVVITCRANKVTFSTIPGKEFPQLYKSKGGVVATFTPEGFGSIFSYLTFAAAQDEARPQLTGVYIEEKGDKLNLVSTDGYRMSLMRVEKGKNKVEEGLIIPVGLVNETLAIKGSGTIEIRISKEENQIIFEIDDVILIGRMIGGSFPDYERVLPKESKTKITLDTEQFLQNIKLSSVFARDVSNVATVIIEGGELKITTETQGVGSGESVMEGKQEGENNKASFNIKYLQDLVKTITEKELVLGINSANEPAVFEVKGKDFKHVIMPIQADN